MTKDPNAVQRMGNLLLLTFLVLGGTLWPRQMLPQALFSLSRITLPYYALLGLESMHREVSMLPFIWPLAAVGCGGIALSFVESGRRPMKAGSGCGRDAAEKRLGSVLPRMFGMGRVKLRSMVGGAAGCAILIGILLLNGMAAHAAQSKTDTLRLAICDLDHSTASESLIAQLIDTEGLSVLVTSSARGNRALMLGEQEGLLIISEGYEQCLKNGDSLPLTYESASGTVSGQSCREVIAGLVMGQKARLRAIDQAQQLLGSRLTEEEANHLLDMIDRCAQEAPALYHATTLDGSGIADPFVPDQMAFCVMAMLLVLLTAAPWCGGQDARAAAVRLRSVPCGRALSVGSDSLALFVLGILTGLCTLLPCGWEPCLKRLPALAASSYCFSAIALFLARFLVLEGRIDGLAPLIALGLCLLGGCFLDLSRLSAGFRMMTLLTPTGLSMEAVEGSAAAWAALLLVGTLFLVGSVPTKRSVTA